ncbi:MAG: hypothetical protein L0229_27625 [Blastocatellia bacterium]|nr:hypothetical protein [Blastocatellia bacterium]
MKLSKSLFALGILIASSLTIFVSVAGAADKRAKGVIREVSLSDAAVTIALRRDDASLTLATDDQTEITLNGQPAVLADLQEGFKVTSVYDTETLVASKLEARGAPNRNLARVEGIIAEVDADAGKLTIEPFHGGPRVTVIVTNSTEITLDGRPARLHDLVPGYSAAASYNENTFEAVRVFAESLAEIRGVVRDVNAVLGTLTIASSNDRVVTLNVPPGTPITLNGLPARLEDLARGYLVKASYNADTLVAERVAAESIVEVTGHIREVDTQAGAVTIAPLVGDEAVELFVVQTTVITVNGEPARLEDLQVGMAARALYDIASLEAIRIEARREGDECTVHRIRGKITGVDLDAETVTIEARDGNETVTLNVTPDTEISINDRPARLSDLRAGMRVRAEFCRERLIAKTIAASAPDSSSR